MCLCLFTGDNLSVEANSHPVFIGPTIKSLSAYSGPLGTSVTITGLGFSTTGNQIKFGDTGSEYNPEYNLPSTDENRKITFTVPSYKYYKCMNDIPKCAVKMDVLPQGTYPITVVNEYGTSTSVNFTVTTSGSNTPSIRVISPNSGFESIEQGSKVEIQWTSNIPSNEMVIVYVSDGINRGNNNLVLNTGNFIYTIDERLPPNSNYKAYVYLASDTVIVDSSDKSFTIKARSSCPTGYVFNGSICIPTNSSITVTSPNSGFESIEQGGKVEIRWTSTVSIGAMVDVYVSDGVRKGNVLRTSNTGNVIYTLDERLTPNSDYRAYVSLVSENPAIDSSDKPFTIKARSSIYPPGCTSYFGYSATKFTRALRYGSRNSQVDALQTILVDKGYLDERYATGLFSNRTRNAVKLLQSANGLTPDGSVGPFTRALLNNLWKTQCIADQDTTTN